MLCTDMRIYTAKQPDPCSHIDNKSCFAVKLRHISYFAHEDCGRECAAFVVNELQCGQRL